MVQVLVRMEAVSLSRHCGKACLPPLSKNPRTRQQRRCRSESLSCCAVLTSVREHGTLGNNGART